MRSVWAKCSHTARRSLPPVFIWSLSQKNIRNSAQHETSICCLVSFPFEHSCSGDLICVQTNLWKHFCDKQFMMSLQFSALELFVQCFVITKSSAFVVSKLILTNWFSFIYSWTKVIRQLLEVEFSWLLVDSPEMASIYYATDFGEYDQSP